MSTELTTGQPVEIVPPGGELAAKPTFENLMHLALQSNVAAENLERIVKLYNEERERQAAAEFADALARFQATCPPIAKTSTANVVSQSRGTKFSYQYAELDEIARTVGPHLHQHGFSYGWDSDVAENRLTVICTLRHRNGHTASARFACPIETKAGMNEQQKYAAALTYGKRQSLTQVLGLTTTEPDPDGQTPADREPITEEQRERLEDLIESSGAKRDKYLKWLGVSDLKDLPRAMYAPAERALRDKQQQKEGK